MSEKKAYVLDTSVLMHDPAAIEQFEDNSVIVPVWVLRELDGLKKEPGDKGAMARSAIRLLDAYLARGLLDNGVNLSSGGKLYVPDCVNDSFPVPNPTTDERIIFTACAWAQQHVGHQVILVSKDISMRVIARGHRVAAEDYLSDKPIGSLDELYAGVVALTLSPSQEAADVIGRLYREKSIALDVLRPYCNDAFELYPNQCCVLTQQEGKSALAVFKRQTQSLHLVAKPKNGGQARIAPLNNEQSFALALLQDPDILLVTLVGRAGAGKTLLSLLGGYEQHCEGNFQQIVVYRPNIELGHPIGYLPGTWEEKFEPWMRPIFDNLELILIGSGDPSFGRGKGKVKSLHGVIHQMLQEKRLAIEPINFVQGRTLHHSFVIVDEAQNLTPEQVKMLITRMGEGSKIVLTGDPEQIAVRFLDATSNGLTHVVECMKGQEIYGHITMKKPEGSRLAELGAELL